MTLISKFKEGKKKLVVLSINLVTTQTLTMSIQIKIR